AGASQLSGYYTDPTPYFKFSPSTDNKAVKGYYVLWSKNTDGDPIEKGKFTKKPEFKAPKLARTGVYYLLISAVDKAGNSSDMVYATYQYWQQ
ncbi:MAG TPA: hypothetical protein VHQ41_03780, partial [Patescibacteria group bacterium]|nr:hypothetical protein [Patescibacteria group bacterium]